MSSLMNYFLYFCVLIVINADEKKYSDNNEVKEFFFTFKYLILFFCFLKVIVYVNKVGPYSNPHETYHYYSLPVCRPSKVK